MTPTERAMIFEFPLCSMLMRIGARRALVRHGHSRQVYLSVSDAGILYHLTLLGIFLLTLERIVVRRFNGIVDLLADCSVLFGKHSVLVLVFHNIGNNSSQSLQECVFLHLYIKPFF